MRIVFLDFDGVLVNRESLQTHSGRMARGAAACIAALNRITDATGARIVVSSTWRLGGLADVRERLREWGATAPVIAVTPWLEFVEGQTRGLEIAEWLKQYEDERETVESFVILDDDSDMGTFRQHLVKTEFEIGLTEADADKAIAHLNKETTK